MRTPILKVERKTGRRIIPPSTALMDTVRNVEKLQLLLFYHVLMLRAAANALKIFLSALSVRYGVPSLKNCIFFSNYLSYLKVRGINTFHELNTTVKARNKDCEEEV